MNDHGIALAQTQANFTFGKEIALALPFQDENLEIEDLPVVQLLHFQNYHSDSVSMVQVQVIAVLYGVL